MKQLKLLLLLAFTFIYISGCGPSNSVRVTDFSPSGKVDKLTNFTVEFSESLAPATVQDKWLTDEFIEFQPKIAGKFKWTSAKTLVFSPDFPLESIQSYKAKITNKVLFNSKFSPDFKTYEFHTPDFDATSADFFWTQIPNQNYKLSVQANLHFNYAVDPAKLKDYLKIWRDGNEIKDYQIVTESPSDVIAVNFGEVQQTDKKQDLTVYINKGLYSVLGKKPLEDDRKFKQELPPITRLAITSVSSGYDGNTGWIVVHTTQTVDEKRLKDFVTTDPAHKLNYTVNENSFRIDGDFGSSPTINLMIKKGLPGLYGGQLEFEYTQKVSLVNLNPAINFADNSGIYLMLSGQKNLEVNAVNLNKAEVEVSQVFKNNLLHFLNRYNYDNNYNYYYGRRYSVGEFGKSLYTEKIDLPNKQNWLQKFTVNLNKVIDQTRKGIFVVNVRSADDRWISDAKMVAVSDLGIIAKQSGNEIIVFVNTISQAEPVASVEVNIISTNNQVILSGKTNDKGIIEFNDIKSKIEGFIPRLVTVEKDGDFNYIDLNKTEVETSRFDVGGIYEYSSDYNTFIYSERNLYRTGDKVNLSGIVRNDKIKIVKDIPIIVKIITPTGKVFDQFKKTLNDEGSFELPFDIPDFAQTGEYVAEVYSGSSQLIGSYRFSVEDFVPDNIRVSLKADKEKAKPGETVSVDIESEFLFGAKASNLKYESETQLIYAPYVSKNYPKFNFSNSSIKNSKIDNVQKKGTLDENGKAVIKYDIPSNIKTGGIFKGNLYVSVFDLTGRTVNQSAHFDVYPNDYYIGIRKNDYYYGTNEKINFQVVAVDQNDKPIKDFKSKVQLVRYEWQTVLKKNYSNHYYYASEQKEIPVWDREFDISGGPKDFTFTVTRSGKYQLRVYKDGSDDYQKTDFYAYGWSSSTSSSFQVDKEGRVEIVLDKHSYSPGDVAKVLLTTPFSGKVLLTFERNNVLEYRYVYVEKRSAEIKVNVTDDFMPNVYVTATLFKKHSMDNTAPFLVGHGFVSMKVDKKENKLPVTINAPKKIKPNTKQQITISTLPERNIYVTLAAVDEGILQIKNYKTPDPYGIFYAKRSLKVTTHDLYKLLLPEIVKMNPSPGGDNNEEELKQLQKRSNPVKTKRFKLLSVWSGILKTDGNGKVTFPLNVPQFNGDIRLMAVAYSGSRFGNAEKHIKVADDLVIEAEIPRFLSTNDSLITTVSLINTTSSKGNVDVNLSVEGPLIIGSSKTQSTNVPANSTGHVNFVIKSGSNIGKAKIKFTTSGLAKVNEEIEIGVRPISPYVVESGSGTIRAGQKLNIDLPKDYIETTQNTTLTISKFPALKFAKQLKYLVGYPYGCIEQTVSKLFPQLYFEDLAKLIAPEYYKTKNPVYFVNEGIKKIESMQMHDGSMSYWQGGTYSNWWGSVYAAHFLLEAKKAKYGVSQNVLNKLLNYISAKAKTNSTYDYVTYYHNSRTVKKIASKEILYSLYVLALANKGDISTMNYYKARPHLLTNDTRYLLAGAYALMGQWNTYYELIPKEYTPENTIRMSGGNFDSEIRANAIMLNVLLEVQPSSDQIPYMIKHIAGMAHDMYSTQERSFAFLALGKAASLNSNTDLKVKINSNGKELKSFNNKDITVDVPSLKNLTLTASGKGDVYYFWSTGGIKINNTVKEEDSYMKVRRTYYEYNTGRESEYNTFGQGQLIVCKITLTGYDKSAENIVITDMLPAGMEIENPRLNASTELQWKPKYPLKVDYLDIRDDRLLLFTDLPRNSTKEFYYMLRVVSKGKFQLPPIGADAMYDPEFHSYNGAGIIKVLGK